MRSDLVKALFKAHLNDDEQGFIETANEIIREEEKKHHNKLAKDLKEYLHNPKKNGISLNGVSKRYKSNIPIPRDTSTGFPLLEIKDAHFNFGDLIISDELRENLDYVVDEYKSREILATYNLGSKEKLLFHGLPGTGKTLTAYVLSSILNFPLVHIRFDSIVSSFLGETATNLRKIFDFIEDGEWVVLFDEFDIIGKKRDDPHEHGEIKRVVNNFMLMLDGYKGDSLLIAATNHPHLLDTAIWRRFDDVLFFGMPDDNLRKELFGKYLRGIKRSPEIKSKLNKLSDLTNGFSPDDIAKICEESVRRTIVSGRNIVKYNDLLKIINSYKQKKEIINKERNG